MLLNSTNPFPRVAQNPLPVMVKTVLVPAVTVVGLTPLTVAATPAAGGLLVMRALGCRTIGLRPVKFEIRARNASRFS